MKRKEVKTFRNIERYSDYMRNKSQRRKEKSFQRPGIIATLFPIALVLILTLTMLSLQPKANNPTGHAVLDSYLSEDEAPKYIHPTQEFSIQKNFELAIDLENLFYHPKQTTNQVAYTIGLNDKLDFSIHQNMLTITPQEDFVGVQYAPLIASTNDASTKVVLKFIVEDVKDFTNKDTNDNNKNNNEIQKDQERTLRSNTNSITGAAMTSITGAVTAVSSCQAITVSDTYELQQDISLTSGTNCIDIQTSNVVLDCLGSYSLAGSGSGVGIEITADPATNIEIRNCDITGFQEGIKLLNKEGFFITLDSNSISQVQTGIIIYDAVGRISDIEIRDTNLFEVNTGMNILANESVIQDNNLSGSSGTANVGIEFQGGSDAYIEGNNIDGFDKAISANNQADGIVSGNNFMNSLSIHAELWNPGMPTGLVFSRVDSLASAPYNIRGNYWEGHGYSTASDDNGDNNVDSVGTEATGEPLPFDETFLLTSGSLAGMPAMSAGISDDGPLLTSFGTASPPPPPLPLSTCLIINTPGLTTLTGPESCIELVGDSITLDCNGYTVQGTGAGDGITVRGGDSSIITNCIVDNHDRGVVLEEASLSFIISDSTFTNNRIGVEFEREIGVSQGSLPSSSSRMLQSNTFSDNTLGVQSTTTFRDVQILDNHFYDNTQDGMLINQGQMLTIDDNEFISNANTGLSLVTNSINSTISNNLFQENNIGTRFGIGSFGNTIEDNVFMENIQYQEEELFAALTNMRARNYYSDALQGLDLVDSTGDNYADMGTQYPYTELNGAKVNGIAIVDNDPNMNPCSIDYDILHSFALTADINCGQHGIVAAASDLMWDGAGFEMVGPGMSSVAFETSGYDDITIQNFGLVQNFGIGVQSTNAPQTGLRIEDNTFDTLDIGIQLTDNVIPPRISNTVIQDNTFTDLQLVGINARSIDSIFQRNVITADVDGVGSQALVLLGGANYLIQFNTLIAEFAFVNAIEPVLNSVISKNNFNGWSEHVSLTAGPTGIDFSPSNPLKIAPDYDKEGNHYPSATDFTNLTDDDSDNFADIPGTTSQSVSLPLTDTSTFAGASVSGMVDAQGGLGGGDHGPMVSPYPTATPFVCSDGIDNDFDTLTDYLEDPDCNGNPFGTFEGIPIGGPTNCGQVTNDLTLTADIAAMGDCYEITSSGTASNPLTLDCNGHTITGNGIGRAIFWDTQNYVEVIDCTITNFGKGIEGMDGSYTTLRDNTITTITTGIELNENSFATQGHTIVDNTVSQGDTNIIATTATISSGTNNEIRRNSFTMTTTGLSITGDRSDIIANSFNDATRGLEIKQGSTGNTVQYNRFVNNMYHTYQEDTGDSNTYSAQGLSAGGILAQHGNLWGLPGEMQSAVMLGITDTNMDNFGDTNTPYSDTNPGTGGNVQGVSDNGPILDETLAPNDPPLFDPTSNPIGNFNFITNTHYTLDLTTYFNDPDDFPQTPLTYGTRGGHPEFTITIVNGIADITNRAPGAVTCDSDVVFTANDGLVVTSSNQVRICSIDNPSIGGDPGGSRGGSGGGSATGECNDGIDNDGDGLIDRRGGNGGELPDPDCAALFSNSEGDPVQCEESWLCYGYTACTDGFQQRTCTDSNNCGTTNNKPDERVSCVEENIPEPPVTTQPTPVAVSTPPTTQQPTEVTPQSQEPWICTTLFPTLIFLFLIVGFIFGVVVLILRVLKQELISRALDYIMWGIVIISFVLMILDWIICKTTSGLAWLLLLIDVALCLFILFYSKRFQEPEEQNEDEEALQNLAPLGEMPVPPPSESSQLQEMQEIEELPEPEDLEPLVEQEEEKIVSEPKQPYHAETFMTVTPSSRTNQSQSRQSQNNQKRTKPEVYLVTTSSQKEKERKKALASVRKELDTLKYETGIDRRSKSKGLKQIDHFLDDMKHIRTDLSVFSVKEPKKNTESSRKQKKKTSSKSKSKPKRTSSRRAYASKTRKAGRKK